jgi:DNA-binding IclR family transcriptional regulator
VYIDQVMRAASRGGYAVAAWLAVRALEGAGVPAPVAKIAEITGMGERVARRAAAALVELRMLRRDGKNLSTVEQRR